MSTVAETGLWRLDAARSAIAVSHVTMWGMVTVKGTFNGVSGEGEVRPDGTVRGVVTLDASSLDTQHKKRDEHLRSADFFDVEHHPTLVFEVRDAVFGQNDVVEVRGQLTVRGVRRPQTVIVKVAESSADAITLATEFTVDRDQFGMSWNRLGMMRGLTTVTSTLRLTRRPA
ncbi:YceI family protein [Amycolatopsis rubida]|uniref:Polyisoprenoid-binding protein YceI n=1 Tax=Amycolatopsis rubida TaxID=112413 RepID=A0A1I5KFP2_9PSEU|nr:YceI family protein [Amycolatopsis rubida]SFO83884.1 Polyisoprenoid-binding protein YceI [Amycolatopsis rubida]